MPITTEHDWEEFQAPLKQFIRKRVPDDAIAEDLLQDVFLNIHLHIETLTHLKQLESWIYQLMRTAIAQYDRQRMSTISVELPEVPQLPEHLPDNDIITRTVSRSASDGQPLAKARPAGTGAHRIPGVDAERVRRATRPVVFRSEVACPASASEAQTDAAGMLPR